MIKAIMWNLNRDLNVDKIKLAFEKTLDFMGETENFALDNFEGLELLFNQEWYAFLTSQSSVNHQSITLTHLALILQELTETPSDLNRILPGYK